MEVSHDSDQEDEVPAPVPWMIPVEFLRRPPLRPAQLFQEDSLNMSTGSFSQISAKWPAQGLEKTKPTEMDDPADSSENSIESYLKEFNLSPEKTKSSTQNVILEAEGKTFTETSEEFINETIVQENAASASFTLPNHPLERKTGHDPTRSLRVQTRSLRVQDTGRAVEQPRRIVAERPLVRMNIRALPEPLKQKPVKRQKAVGSSTSAKQWQTRTRGTKPQDTKHKGLLVSAKRRNRVKNQQADRKGLRRPSIKRSNLVKKRPADRKRLRKPSAKRSSNSVKRQLVDRKRLRRPSAKRSNSVKRQLVDRKRLRKPSAKRSNSVKRQLVDRKRLRKPSAKRSNSVKRRLVDRKRSRGPAVEKRSLVKKQPVDQTKRQPPTLRRRHIKVWTWTKKRQVDAFPPRFS